MKLFLALALIGLFGSALANGEHKDLNPKYQYYKGQDGTIARVGWPEEADYMDDDGVLYDHSGVMLIDHHGDPLIHEDVMAAFIEEADKAGLHDALLEQDVHAEGQHHENVHHDGYEYIPEDDPRFQAYFEDAEYFDDDGKLYDKQGKALTDDNGDHLYYGALQGFLGEETTVGANNQQNQHQKSGSAGPPVYGDPMSFAHYYDDAGHLYDQHGNVLVDQDNLPFFYHHAEGDKLQHISDRGNLSSFLNEEVLFDEGDHCSHCDHCEHNHEEVDLVTSKDPRYHDIASKAEYFDDNGHLYDVHGNALQTEDGAPIFFQFSDSVETPPPAAETALLQEDVTEAPEMEKIDVDAWFANHLSGPVAEHHIDSEVGHLGLTSDSFLQEDVDLDEMPTSDPNANDPNALYNPNVMKLPKFPLNQGPEPGSVDPPQAQHEAQHAEVAPSRSAAFEQEDVQVQAPAAAPVAQRMRQRRVPQAAMQPVSVPPTHQHATVEDEPVHHLRREESEAKNDDDDDDKNDDDEEDEEEPHHHRRESSDDDDKNDDDSDKNDDGSDKNDDDDDDKAAHHRRESENDDDSGDDDSGDDSNDE